MSAPNWNNDQQFEAAWWGTCINTFGEETKQITYAHRMGIAMSPLDGHWPVYDLQGKSVLDIGGGPASMLLKAVNVTNPTVVDPCPYPEWVKARYETGGIQHIIESGEAFRTAYTYDECWIYNVLQHVQDPEQVIRAAKQCSKTIRLFEWIDLPPHVGHPHELKSDRLDAWLDGTGQVENMNENGCNGMAYYGVFG